MALLVRLVLFATATSAKEWHVLGIDQLYQTVRAVQSGDVILLDNMYEFRQYVWIVREPLVVAADNVTIRPGDTARAWMIAQGGSWAFAFRDARNITLENIRFTCNMATPSGSVMHGSVATAHNASVTLRGCSVENCGMPEHAAIELSEGELHIVDSTFRNCATETLGGAIFAQGFQATVSVSGSTFKNNVASLGGAAIGARVRFPNIRLYEGNRFVNNSAVSKHGQKAGKGGALHIWSNDGLGLLHFFAGQTFADNKADDCCPAIWNRPNFMCGSNGEIINHLTDLGSDEAASRFYARECMPSSLLRMDALAGGLGAVPARAGLAGVLALAVVAIALISAARAQARAVRNSMASDAAKRAPTLLL